jgi:hypothetical protein
MIRSIVFVLRVLDELAEALVVAAFRAVRRHPWRVAMLALLIAGVHQSCTGRLNAAAKRLKAWWSPTLAVRVFEVRGGAYGHEAVLTIAGQRWVARPGSIYMRDSAPLVILAAADCQAIAYYDCAARRLVHVPFTSPGRRPIISHPAPHIRVNAIAGDAPHRIAVVEYQGQTYIVQAGTPLPDDLKAELEVTAVSSDRVSIRNVETGAGSTWALQTEDDDLGI